MFDGEFLFAIFNILLSWQVPYIRYSRSREVNTIACDILVFFCIAV